MSEFGYVLRYVHQLDGKAYFEVPRNGVSSRTIGSVNVFTLAQANARLKALREGARDNLHREPLPFREIVRVRRVPGADQWRDATAWESAEYGFQYGDDITFRFGQNEPAVNVRLQKRIPGEPRWEVAEE
jgi:hypothetical protein